MRNRLVRLVHTEIEPAHLEMRETEGESQCETPGGHLYAILEATCAGPSLGLCLLDTSLSFSNDLAKLTILAFSSVKLKIRQSLGHREIFV